MVERTVPKCLYKYPSFSNLTLGMLIDDTVYYADPADGRSMSGTRFDPAIALIAPAGHLPTLRRPPGPQHGLCRARDRKQESP